MIEFTDDELHYIATRLLGQPYRALTEVLTQDKIWIEVCPDCLHEVWCDEDSGDEAGHESKCPRQLRYALMDKLDAYYEEKR